MQAVRVRCRRHRKSVRRSTGRRGAATTPSAARARGPPKAANDVGTKSVTHGNGAIEVAVQAVNDVLSSARRKPSSAIAPSAERRNSRQARTAQQGPQRDEDPRSWRVAPDGWGEGVGVIPTASMHAEFVRREAARLAAASSRPLISSSVR